MGELLDGSETSVPEPKPVILGEQGKRELTSFSKI